MSEQRNVKVFISWSGDLSKAVAVALRAWLPLLFDRVEPWASDTDIAAGQRGLAQIEAELEGTQFGIVVVTAANQGAPWINFEAGAMSKTIAGDVDQRVVPLLVDLSGPAQLTGPLAQFQAKVADRQGVLDVLRSLGAVAGIQEQVVDARYARYWEDLETSIAEAKDKAGAAGPAKAPREQSDVLDEILLHLRALRSDIEATSGGRGGSTKVKAAAGNDLRNRVEHLARSLNLDLHRFESSPDGLQIMVGPSKGHDFSQEVVDRFNRGLDEFWVGNATIDAVPF